MTTQITENCSFIASGGLTVNRFCKLHSTDGQVIVSESTTGVIGVVAETVATGLSVPVMTKHGAVVDIELGATLAADDFVMPDTGGVAVALAGVDAIGAGQLVRGGDSGDIVPMVFFVIRGVSA